MRVVAIIQARTGSSRLPGKVLANIGGKSMLMRVIERVQQARLVDTIVVATTDGPADDAIAELCGRMRVDVFRGSEPDVLDRYYHAAQAHGAEAIVRVTADCPLIDPEVANRVIRAFLDGRPHYASNILQRTYPRGLDTEVVAFDALERAWHEATASYHRTHVTPYICAHEGLFRLLSVTGEPDCSHHRWTVDTFEDLTFVRAVYARLADPSRFGRHDVLELLAREPRLLELNRHVCQKVVTAG